jgi:hypothetical protein
MIVEAATLLWQPDENGITLSIGMQRSDVNIRRALQVLDLMPSARCQIAKDDARKCTSH